MNVNDVFRTAEDFLSEKLTEKEKAELRNKIEVDKIFAENFKTALQLSISIDAIAENRIKPKKTDRSKEKKRKLSLSFRTPLKYAAVFVAALSVGYLISMYIGKNQSANSTEHIAIKLENTRQELSKIKIRLNDSIKLNKQTIDSLKQAEKQLIQEINTLRNSKSVKMLTADMLVKQSIPEMEKEINQKVYYRSSGGKSIYRQGETVSLSWDAAGKAELRVFNAVDTFLIKHVYMQCALPTEELDFGQYYYQIEYEDEIILMGKFLVLP